jgi:hypothetical protein
MVARLRVPLGTLLLFAVACGSGTTVPLNASIGGTWNGSGVASFGAGGSYTYDSTVVITVSGDVATVRGVCSDGTGTVAATGSGNSASVTGTLTCQGIPLSGCESVVFTYTQVAVTLTSNNTIQMGATGNANGCSESTTLTTAFTGTLFTGNP